MLADEVRTVRFVPPMEWYVVLTVLVGECTLLLGC